MPSETLIFQSLTPVLGAKDKPVGAHYSPLLTYFGLPLY